MKTQATHTLLDLGYRQPVQNDKIMDWPGIKMGTCLSIKVLNFPSLRLLASKLN